MQLASANISQKAKNRIRNQQVAGSIPAGGSIVFYNLQRPTAGFS
jgi:hypothetical protein